LNLINLALQLPSSGFEAKTYKILSVIQMAVF